MRRTRAIFCLASGFVALAVAMFLVAGWVRAEDVKASPPKFSITFPAEDAKLPVGKTSAKGTHEISPDTHVWLFLRDAFGGYYLQSPPVELRKDKKWTQDNLTLGTNIREIVAVEVNDKVHKDLSERVEKGNFGKIDAETFKKFGEVLARVSIATPDK